MKMLNVQLFFKMRFAAIYTAFIKSSFGSFGKNSLIRPPFLCFDAGDIHIGDNCTIAENGWIQGIREYAGKKFSPRLEIGNGTYIGRNSHIIACLEMKIGRNVVFADGVYVTDNLHGFKNINMPIMEQELETPGPVIIEDEVWLGEHVCVMPGVTIGKHSVIGSNAVVTKTIPPYSVAVGGPARIIKTMNPASGKWEKVI
jgi:acetyltransferase-like isoleucine patch superfamily enzyme